MERGREKGGNKTLTLTSFLILDKKAFNFICLNNRTQRRADGRRALSSGTCPVFSQKPMVFPQGGACNCGPAIDRVWMGKGDVVITSH